MKNAERRERILGAVAQLSAATDYADAALET
jgi:hypothetical protein